MAKLNELYNVGVMPSQSQIQQEMEQELFDMQLDQQLDDYYAQQLNQGGAGSGRKPSKRRVGRPSAADRKRYEYNLKRRKNSGL